MGRAQKRHKNTGIWPQSRSTLPRVIGRIKIILIGVFFAVVLVAATCATLAHFQKAEDRQSTGPVKQPTTLRELLAMPQAERDKCDIARVNLLCAESLLGAEKINIDFELATLDRWANEMKPYIASCDEDFQKNPEKFRNNENLGRMAAVVMFLKRVHHATYDPNRDCLSESNKVFFANSQDLFLHGLIEEPHFGTCSSIPVLLVAVGRRLGYPLKLVTTPHHVYARWESPDGKASFNIEGTTSQGMGSPDDDHYKKPPFTKETDTDVNSGEYYHPLAPSEELANFLSLRAYCLLANKHTAEAKEAFTLGVSIAPTVKSCAHAANTLDTYLRNHSH